MHIFTIFLKNKISGKQESKKSQKTRVKKCKVSEIIFTP